MPRKRIKLTDVIDIREENIEMFRNQDGKYCGVYFIYEEDNVRCKIGFSKDIERRLKNIRGDNSHGLYVHMMVLAHEKYLPTIEKMLHVQFQNYHVANEWFNIPKNRLPDRVDPMFGSTILRIKY